MSGNPVKALLTGAFIDHERVQAGNLGSIHVFRVSENAGRLASSAALPFQSDSEVKVKALPPLQIVGDPTGFVARLAVTARKRKSTVFVVVNSQYQVFFLRLEAGQQPSVFSAATNTFENFQTTPAANELFNRLLEPSETAVPAGAPA